jgi:hypothetical protein
MSASETNKHCTEQELLEHIDGELPRAESASIDRHLLACWRCRTVRAQLEATIHKVASVAESGSLRAEEVADARRRFLASAREYERDRRQSSSWRRWTIRSLVPVPLAFAIALAMWLQRTETALELSVAPPHPRVETALLHSPVAQHQRFRVSFLPGGKGSDLEVWTDKAGRRTHLTWRHLPIEDASGAARDRKRRSILSALTETGFLAWVTHREAGPIELREIFSEIARTPRAQSRVEHRTDTALLFVSGASAGGGEFVAMLEIDRQTLQPRSLRLRVHDEGGARELLLTGSEQAFHRRLPAFVPVRSAGRIKLQDAEAPVRELRAPPRAPLPPERHDSGVASAVAEIEARYVLHRLNATTFPTRITSRAGGPVRVEVVVPDEERKQAILSAMAELNRASLIDASIRTVEELVREAEGDLPADTRHATVRPFEIPIQRALETYLAGSGGQATRYANDAVARAQTAHADAYCLTELWTRSEELAGLALPPNARWLLEVMLRDRVRRLRTYVEEERRTRSPLLVRIAGPDRGEPQPGSLMEGFAEIRSLTQYLFAGSLAPGDSPAGRFRLSVENAAGRLLALLDSRELCCEEAEQRLAREFPVEGGSRADGTLRD